MKILHIHAKALIDIKLPDKELKKLPEKIGLVTTIQHLHKLGDIQNQLPSSIIAGQILGCDVKSAEKISDKVDAFLFIGSGVFHPLAVAIKTKKQVFCWNPFVKEMKTIGKKEIEAYEKKKKASLTRFLSSDRIGILVCTKPGQYHLEKALKLKEKSDKNYYLFQFDTLNIAELENFNFIQCWVNTACPRISEDKANIINIDDIPNF